MGGTDATLWVVRGIDTAREAVGALGNQCASQRRLRPQINAPLKSQITMLALITWTARETVSATVGISAMGNHIAPLRQRSVLWWRLTHATKMGARVSGLARQADGALENPGVRDGRTANKRLTPCPTACAEADIFIFLFLQRQRLHLLKSVWRASPLKPWPNHTIDFIEFGSMHGDVPIAISRCQLLWCAAAVRGKL